MKMMNAAVITNSLRSGTPSHAPKHEDCPNSSSSRAPGELFRKGHDASAFTFPPSVSVVVSFRIRRRDFSNVSQTSRERDEPFLYSLDLDQRNCRHTHQCDACALGH